MSTRLVALTLVLLLAAGLAGCGLGAGDRDTEARVLVTRDFGGDELGGRIFQAVPSSETVMRLLQRGFDVKTRYGGGFVQSIDGLAGGREDGRPVDWFFYVNGVDLETGAAEVDVHDGDRIWWDRHDWGATAHVPAVVGSYPGAVRARSRRQALPGRARVRRRRRGRLHDGLRAPRRRTA